MTSPKKNRVKIPEKTAIDIMFWSNRQCCVDQKPGVHIHHLDENPSNNDIDNLALLCFECHDEASKRGGLSRRLSPGVIKRYREEHYKKINTTRSHHLVNTKKQSYNDTLNASIEGYVLVELAKIKAEYFESVSMDRNSILKKMAAFKEFNFPSICFELYKFLERISYETRSGLPFKMIETIVNLIEDYFPEKHEGITKSELEEIGKLSIQIAFGIIYDTSIYSHKYYSMSLGYDLLQFINEVSISINSSDLKNSLSLILENLESTLNRSGREDLDIAKHIFYSYKKHIIEGDFQPPIFNNEIRLLMDNEK